MEIKKYRSSLSENNVWYLWNFNNAYFSVWKWFWGARKDGLWALDKVFLRFVRCTLGIKATTSNVIVAGECGRLPPSTQCTILALCYMNRVMHTNGGSLVQQVYHELRSLHDQGFNTWVTRMHKLADDYQKNLSQDPAKFHPNCKIVVRTN